MSRKASFLYRVCDTDLDGPYGLLHRICFYQFLVNLTNTGRNINQKNLSMTRKSKMCGKV